LRRRAHSIGKRIGDLIGALSILTVSFPVCVLIAAAIRADSRGPVIFSHERIGCGGRRFRMYKFRTLHASAPQYQSKHELTEAEMTRVGRILRRLGLDELPQFLNVLRGDMSLVGPRPEMPFVADMYSPLERLRLSVKPGITGPWQLDGDHGRPIHAQLHLDLRYLQLSSLLYDVWLLARTAFFLIRASLTSVNR
jgi:lipopolysaccharide/colanic/teichoic acid biosynthesis glycosyltransferase